MSTIAVLSKSITASKLKLVAGMRRRGGSKSKGGVPRLGVNTGNIRPGANGALDNANAADAYYNNPYVILFLIMHTFTCTVFQARTFF